jgi:hypothetical protein
MTSVLTAYQKRKQELKKYMSELDNKCMIYSGPHTSFSYPVSDPLKTYSSVEDLKERVLPKPPLPDKKYFSKQSVCKFRGKYLSRDVDKTKRYFKYVKTQDQCTKLGGHWDPNSLNRTNKWDKGVCWVDPVAKTCAATIQSNQENITRPYRSKIDPDYITNITQDIDKCNNNNACVFEQQTAYTFDCIPKVNKAQPEKSDTMDPIASMPVANFERFLEDWYVYNKFEAPPPKTMKLLGEGDRCKGNLDVDAMETPPPPKFGTFENFRVLNPEKYKELFIEKLGGPKEYQVFLQHWQAKNRLSEMAYTRMLNKRPDPVELFYQRMELDQLENDYEINLKTTKRIKTVPTVPQSIVNMVMKHIAKIGSDNKGLLAWHSTGSGKTATATGVIDSFWDDSRRIIFASSLDAIASNPDWKFHQCAQRFFPRFRDLELDYIGELFKKRDVKFYSFARLSNRVRRTEDLKKRGQPVPLNDNYVDLNKSVLIIDEVHNLFRPLPTQKQQHEYLEGELMNVKKYGDLKIVILTATPGDNEADVVKLLNIIRNPKAPPITVPNIDNIESLNAFKNSIRGMVSFFDMSNDSTRFPKTIENDIIKCPMSATHFSKYVEAYNIVTDIQKNFKHLAKNNQVNKYWSPARKYANTLFNFEKNMNLQDFSAKMPFLMATLKKYPDEKHYIYSAFYTSHGYGGHGVIAIAKLLEKQGYTKLSVQEARKLNKDGSLPKVGKRYILAITTELGENAGDNLAELIKIYNHPKNKNGEYIHVMVASQGFNEGIDLKAVRHIHFFEPLVTMASDKQTLGRAVRSCSHEDLTRADWIVNIHRYMNSAPNLQAVVANKADLEKELAIAVENRKNVKTKSQKEEIQNRIKKLRAALKKSGTLSVPMIEELIFKESRERMRSLMIIYQCLKEAALDCRVLNEFHSRTGHEIKCAF